MKRTSIILLSVMAITACSKTEVNYNDLSEIRLAPVSSMNTKAAVDGTDYPAALDFYLFANAGYDTDADGIADQGETYTDIFLDYAKFTDEADGTENNKVFAGDPTCYWPNVKSLIFAGVSASGNVASLTAEKVNMDFVNNQLTITGYTQPDSGNNDLMWFSKTTPYDKDANAIPVSMKHACAWLEFTFKGDAVTAADGSAWKILDVKVLNVAKKGNATCGESSATWDTLSEEADYIVYDNASGTPLTTAGVTPKDEGKDAVVIPQGQKSIYFKYSFTSQAGQTIEEEKTIELTGDWVSGTHYIYTITIGATEIKIAPSATSWGDPVSTTPTFN